MKLKLIWKLIIASPIIGAVLVFDYFAVIILAIFTKEGKFFIPLILAVTVFIIAFFVLWMIAGKWPGRVMIVMLAMIVLSVLAGIGYTAYNYGKENVATVNDQGVNLYQYQPFDAKSRVKKLNVKSTIQLKDGLPRLDGATALYPLYSSFVQAAYPEQVYDPYDSIVKCMTTPQAYDNLMNGNADIIFCAKPSDDQVKKAKEKGLTFELTSIGREAFVFFVNKKNRVNALTSEQIRSIYSGKIKDWKEVGGKSGNIIAYQRPENSGSQTMLQKIMKGAPIMKPLTEEVMAGMGDIIQQTAVYKNYGNAIGYSFLFFATEMVKNNQIKLIEIDGVKPSRASIKDKTYPFAADFYAVTCGKKSRNTELLIQWILSEQGQYLVDETGYTPVKE